jgi:hypothetical protein
MRRWRRWANTGGIDVAHQPLTLTVNGFSLTGAAAHHVMLREWCAFSYGEGQTKL